MHAKRLTPLLLGSSLAASSTLAFALGLGDATPRSALGEPLQLNIPINIAPGEEVGEHCFNLRPAPFNQASGLPTVTQGSVSVMRSAAGKAVLRISTSAPIDEPMIALGIETRCKINVARDYSIFLSPRSGKADTTTLAADAVWDVPANHIDPLDTVVTAGTASAASDTPAATLAQNSVPTLPATPIARRPAQPVAGTPAAAPASATAATPVAASVPAQRPAIATAAAAQAMARSAATHTVPANTPRPAPAATLTHAVSTTKPMTAVAALTPTVVPQAPRQPAAAIQRSAAPPPPVTRAASPRPVAAKPAAAARDAQLAELSATVDALRAQVAAQEKRLQELAAPQVAPLRVSGRYRPDGMIPATLNVPIARNDAQTVVYRAAPIAVPQSSGVSLATLGLALLVTALAAAGSGHYVGRRTAEASAGNRGTRNGRRPVRRPRG